MVREASRKSAVSLDFNFGHSLGKGEVVSSILTGSTMIGSVDTGGRVHKVADAADSRGLAMSRTTRATQFLVDAGIAFTLHTYDYDPNADRIGLQAAEALGESPSWVLKTLMAEVDGKPVCVVVPSDREVSMKRLASTFGGKTANMMKPADAERLTGYRVGGISPFRQKRTVPTAIDNAALNEPLVYINGGQRGLQVRLVPAAALTALNAQAADLVA